MIKASNKNHWLLEAAELFPDKIAMLYPKNELSYKTFCEKSFSLAAHFSGIGIKSSDRVALYLNNSVEYLIIINALWFLGAIPVLINRRIVISELEQQLSKSDLKYVISDQLLSINNSFGVLQLDELLCNVTDSNTYIPDEFDAENKSLIMFTSGSTGKPKAVVHTFASMYNSVVNADSLFNFSINDKWLASLPFYHIGGLMIAIRSLITTSSVAFPNSLKNDDVEESINIIKPSHISLVPTSLRRMLEKNYQLPENMKYIFLGGAPISKELYFSALENHYPIVKVYGSTETCSMVTALLPEYAGRNSDSVGTVLGNSIIKIINSEVAIKSNSLFSFYYNDTDTTQVKFQEGFYLTGDNGLLDQNGFLFITSRADEIVISGGENISVIEVENEIRKIEGVHDAAVFGLNDRTWGEIVSAAIVLKTDSDLNENEISRILKPNIASYKIPRKFFFINSIPRTELGKVSREELREILKIGI